MKVGLWVSTIVASSLMMASCGAQSTTTSPYADFCNFAAKMEATSASDHSSDPSAISDPVKMKSSWSEITQLALQMRDNSPSVIKGDVALMVESIVAMNDLFEENSYDLFAMSKNEKLRARLDAISSDPEVTGASQRFNSFMQDNCKN